MKRSWQKLALGVLAPALLTVGCSDFLTGDKLSNNPNIPTEANSFLLLNGVTVGMTTVQTGEVARAAGMWMQQFSGTDRQYLTLDRYGETPDDFTSDFNQAYIGGGLVDIRKIEEQSVEAGDSTFLGIALVWEALDMGTQTSLFGDVPYSQALNADPNHPPKFDNQDSVYATVQRVLDRAITALSVSSAGPGPKGADLIYGGDPAKWIAAAHTLKARYYMHQAEKNPANYALALAQTAQGISSPSGDFRTYQSSTPGEENIWNQFMFRERDSYIRGGAFLIDSVLEKTSDPRLADWFSPDGSGNYTGAKPGSANTQASVLNIAKRGSASFRQPVVTWAENQLMRAEALMAMDSVTNAVEARTLLNAVKSAAAADTVAATVTGTALRQAIAMEQYVSLFQNIEVWNTWKRTCYPNLTPYGTFTNIPRRLYYGSDEMNAQDPANIPAQDNVLWNPNDLAGGTVTPAGSCKGQTQGGRSGAPPS